MYLNSSKILGLMPDCKLTCSKIVSEVATCSKTIGNRTVLNVTYFLFRFEAYFYVNSKWDGKCLNFHTVGQIMYILIIKGKNWNENVMLIETHIWYMEFQTHPQNVCFYVLGVFLFVMGLFFHDLKTRLKHANILIRKLITILLTKNFCTCIKAI